VHGHYIHFDWRRNEDAVLGGDDRGIGYSAYEIATCGLVFDPPGIWANALRAGYVGIDAHALDAMNNWAVPVAHEAVDGVYSPRGYWDFIAGGPAFGVFTSDWPNKPLTVYGWSMNAGTGPGNETIWPKGDWDIDGNEQVLHIVTSESGTPGVMQTYGYFRRVGAYGTDLGVWSQQRLVDTGANINPQVSSSPVSDKVAIVWSAPIDERRDTEMEFFSSIGPGMIQILNDVWFAIATDNGAAWAATPTPAGPSIGNTVDLGIGVGYNPNVGGNLTTYPWDADYKAYCDMSALWFVDTLGDDWLQIIWNARRNIDTTGAYRRHATLYHWNQKFDEIRTVVRTAWDTGGNCNNYIWNMDIGKPTISQCDGKLYICYSQFGDRDHICNWFTSTLGVNGAKVNSGYLHMAVYEEQYRAWDRAQRVTTETISPDDCTAGDMSDVNSGD
jgi:hypothetical protein